MAPALGPAGFAVAAEGVAVVVHGRLEVALREEDFADAVVGERALRIGVEGLLIFGERSSQIVLRDELLALEDRDANLEVGRGLEHPIAGIDDDMAGTAEGVDDVRCLSADDILLLVLGFALGFNAHIHGHVEEVEILLDLTDGAESLAIAETVD